MVYVIPILILVAFSALFSSTETAFACVNKIRLKHMADSGDKRAEKALDIANRYEQALTAILVGNNVVNIGASSLATIFFTAHFGSAGAAISTIVMTVLVLTFEFPASTLSIAERTLSSSNSTSSTGSRLNSERIAYPSSFNSADTCSCMAGSSSVIQVAFSALMKRPFSFRLRARMM